MWVFISSFFKGIKARPTEFPGARKTENKEKIPNFFCFDFECQSSGRMAIVLVTFTSSKLARFGQE